MNTRRPRTPAAGDAKRRARSNTATAHSARLDPDGPGLIVKADPLRTRVETLTKEHDRLLREIAKKRAQLNAAEQLSRDLFASLVNRTTPLRERLRNALGDIQRSFTKLLGATSRLNRREKAKVRRVYEDLVSVLDLPEIEAPGLDVESDDEPQPHHNPRSRAGQSKGGDFGSGGYSAHKPADDNHPSLRALFKRLAIAFHPDKVQDEQAKAERTSLMKDVTKAYETGDLARLMELERALLSRLPVANEPEALERRAKELQAANAELRRQQRSLTAALKELTLELPFDVNLKAADAQQRAMREVDQLVIDLEQEERRIAGLRDFIRDFADDRMDIADFLAGPRLPDESSAGEMALGDDLLLDLIEDLLRGARPSAPVRAAGRSGGRRHRP